MGRWFLFLRVVAIAGRVEASRQIQTALGPAPNPAQGGRSASSLEVILLRKRLGCFTSGGKYFGPVELTSVVVGSSPILDAPQAKPCPLGSRGTARRARGLPCFLPLVALALYE